TAPRAITPWALGAFFVFATLMTALTAATLFAPDTPLTAIWSVKPTDYEALRALAPASAFAFAALSLAMAATAFGCLLRKRWGLMLALAIFSVNALGDAGRAFFGAPLEAALGVSIAGAIIWWLLRPRVRALFA